MAKLLDMFATINKVESELVLQCLVFIAQKLNLLDIDKRYNFHSSSSLFALPFSMQLETELVFLEKEGFLLDTRTAESIVLTQKGRNELKRQSTLIPIPDTIKELSELSAEKLRTVARVLYASELFGKPDEGEKLKEKIIGYLGIDREEVDEAFRILERLKGY